MIGTGAFDNPLLSSHAFGFFCMYWLTLGMTSKRLTTVMAAAPAFLIMFAALLATGSRDTAGRGGSEHDLAQFHLLESSLPGVDGHAHRWRCCGFALFSEMIFSRGNSFRFELWGIAVGLIGQKPFFGHGYEAPLALELENSGYFLQRAA